MRPDDSTNGKASEANGDLGPSYVACHTKRRRRTKAEMNAIREAIYAVAERDQPVTVRQVFYRLVSQGVIGKTELEYNRTVCRLLSDMRCEGEIPYGWLADHTRWMRKPKTWSSAEEALRITSQAYRRSVWSNQDVHVEIWLEKEALAGVLYDETQKYDVPLMVTKGYSSLTYLYEAAEAIKAEDKPAFIYQVGDHDPSGVNIPVATERTIRQIAPGAEITFKRVAVTVEQIEAWDLPTRPTKASDPRAKSFEGESVEADAIEPNELRRLVREAIEQHVDRGKLAILKIAEESERELLMKFTRVLDGQRNGAAPRPGRPMGGV